MINKMFRLFVAKTCSHDVNFSRFSPDGQKADESLNFDEQILEAAKSIAAATAALVKSASAAQRELVAQGKVSCSLRPLPVVVFVTR